MSTRQDLVVPYPLRSTDELNRRVTGFSGAMVERLEFLESRVTTSFVGLYDQVADDIDANTPGAQPLDAATNYNAGDFYTLSVTGVFSTTIPELAGKSGGPGDQIISDGTVWLLLEYSGAFLSSVSDDQASGVITFVQVPVSNAAPVGGNDLTRKSYVDTADATHAALQADPDDVHGAKTYTDAQDAAHVAAPDPHPQYTLETDALQVFSFAGYGGMYTDTPAAVSIGLGWDTVPWDASAITVPRSVTVDPVTDTFTFTVDGVFMISIAGAFGHNESNQGRNCYLRFYDVTSGAPGPTEFRLFTGRNMAGTPAAWSFLAEITEALKGNSWRLEVGGTTDSYSVEDWTGELAIYNVGEWREPLPSD